MSERIDLYVAQELVNREQCSRLVSACFASVRELLGELDAWAMFVQFAKAASPDPAIAARDKRFEEQLLAAYDGADEGARDQAATEIGRLYRKPSEIALRRLARILCRRATFASSKEQLRLTFGLDPFEKIRMAHDEFAQLAQGATPPTHEPPAEGFGHFLSSDTIGMPSQSGLVPMGTSSSMNGEGPTRTNTPYPTKEGAGGDAELERPIAEVVELRQLTRRSRKSAAARRRQDGA